MLTLSCVACILSSNSVEKGDSGKVTISSADIVVLTNSMNCLLASNEASEALILLIVKKSGLLAGSGSGSTAVPTATKRPLLSPSVRPTSLRKSAARSSDEALSLYKGAFDFCVSSITSLTSGGFSLFFLKSAAIT